MTRNARSRFDRLEQAEEGFLASWGIRFQKDRTEFSEYLVAVYDLREKVEFKPVKHSLTVTHEVVVFALSPVVKIKFGKSLYDQPKLQPLTPHNHGYQIVARDDDHAVQLVQSCVARMMSGELTPDKGGDTKWGQVFPGSFSLTAGPDAEAKRPAA